MNLKETPVPARMAELLRLHGRGIRVKKLGHVDDRQLVGLVLTDDFGGKDLVRPDVTLGDVGGVAGEHGLSGVRDLVPVDHLLASDLHCSAVGTAGMQAGPGCLFIGSIVFWWYLVW